MSPETPRSTIEVYAQPALDSIERLQAEIDVLAAARADQLDPKEA